MSIYKEAKTNTWRVIYRYTDWTGERKQTQKRGFKTKREAQAWEREQTGKLSADLDMTFASFVERYEEDMRSRVKETTWSTKAHMIKTKFLPYFGKLKMNSITSQQIIKWQNTMIDYRNENGEAYSPVYLRTLNSQLSAIFNHAFRFYDLRDNPCKKVPVMGKAKGREMDFWTKEEYLKFADVMMDKPLYFYAFEVLYWCGIREGELFALTPADFNFKTGNLSITKNLQHVNGRNIITPPKTEKSVREISMPKFLQEEIKELISMTYGVQDSDRLFPISKSALVRQMEYGIKKANLKHIRVHDLRHSHVSLLINMGYSAVAIGNRVGHESVDITFRYAHMFPSVQKDMAEKLNIEGAERGAEICR